MTVAKTLEQAVIFTTGTGKEFILETQCFRDLQTYLQLATKLPSTNELYETEFPKEYFEAFFKDNGSLYTALQGCFVNIHTHCAGCKTVLIPLMITFANDMAAFATESNTRHKEIDSYMTTATAAGAKLTDESVKSAFRDAAGVIGDILAHAAEMKAKCEELKLELSKFGEQTKADKRVLSPLYTRFVAVIPEGQKVSVVVNKLIEESRAAYEQARKTANENYVSTFDYILACLGEAGTDEMVYYNDDGRNAENARRYWNSKACQKAYENSLSEYNETKTALNNALANVSMLNTSLTQINASISNAITSVDKMTSSPPLPLLIGYVGLMLAAAFSLMPTQFDKITRDLNSISAATTKANADDRRSKIKRDLLNVPTTWIAIGKTAEDFATNGKIFKEKES